MKLPRCCRHVRLNALVVVVVHVSFPAQVSFDSLRAFRAHVTTSPHPRTQFARRSLCWPCFAVQQKQVRAEIRFPPLSRQVVHIAQATYKPTATPTTLPTAKMRRASVNTLRQPPYCTCRTCRSIFSFLFILLGFERIEPLRSYTHAAQENFKAKHQCSTRNFHAPHTRMVLSIDPETIRFCHIGK
jgi:hypothetical protein